MKALIMSAVLVGALGLPSFGSLGASVAGVTPPPPFHIVCYVGRTGPAPIHHHHRRACQVHRG
jgi:hypothetical protein